MSSMADPVSQSSLNRVVRNQGFVLVLIAIYCGFSIMAPSFFGLSNFAGILNAIAPNLIIAAGMAFVVIGGQLDISVGSTAYVASAIVAITTSQYGLSLTAGVLLALGAGVCLGIVNALIVVGLRVNALVATLGTMISFRGIGLLMTDGGLVNLTAQTREVGQASISLPVPGAPDGVLIYLTTLLAIVVLVLVHLLHQRTNFGRQITAIGNSDETARRLGIPVAKRLFAAFVLSGFLGALGGVVFTMKVGVNTAKIGEGMEFIAIAIIVIGGVSLFGGRGHILRAVFLGALAFQMIRSGLQHSDASPYSFRLVEGVIIFLAMYVDALKRND